MKLREKMTFYLQVIKKFRPFFRSKNAYNFTFQFSAYEIKEDITSIYNKMLKLPSKKYQKDKKRYKIYVNQVNKHNEEIKFINEILDSWNYSKNLENPLKISQDYIEKCKKTSDLLKKYKNYNNTIFQDELSNLINNYLEICLEFDSLNEFNDLFNFKKYRYIDYKKKLELKNKSLKIIERFHTEKYFYSDYEKYNKIDELINEHNIFFKNNERFNFLFDNINNKSLDFEQRDAVLTDEHAVLVVAGAGSGKTLTICGKVEYLIKQEKVDPNDILLLSYSKKSATDLEEKILKIDNRLTVGTFHKLGLTILKTTQNKVFMVEDQYKAIIEQYFREEMNKRPKVLKKVLLYYGMYISTLKHNKTYKSEGEMYEDLKKTNFKTLKNELLSYTNDFNSKETIKKELVKSYEEMAIANWYFINGVDYIYEAPYEYDVSTKDKRQYMPDFKLKKYGVYHEHYGLNKDGTSSQYSDEEAAKYQEGVQWKRQIHSQNKTDCIETFSYEFSNGTIFDKLENELKIRNIQLHPLSEDEIKNALQSIYESRSFKSFINLIRTFLSLYKTLYRDEHGFDELKNRSFRNLYEQKRAALFLEIVKDVYCYYIDYLNKEGKIDFDDMILQSTEVLDNIDSFKYKYIIVDEFQDISISRMKFLKKLIEHGESKLFAVGDDWQAIYRFSGCDLNIFIDFKNYFGESAITKITTTHRNSQELQDIVGPFIRKNPEQIAKSIYSNKRLENPIRVAYYNQNKCEALLKVLEDINSKDPNAHVLILGRNNKDFEDIYWKDKIFINFKESNENQTFVTCKMFPKMEITYSTVHGSKGLEEDYVILINANDDVTGFPNKMEDDELLDLVLSHKSEYEYAEERRLWYVALTRTRNYTYIIADANNPSIFLEEIKDKCFVIENSSTEINDKNLITCPYCKTGILQLKTNHSNGNLFYSCSNYPYCNYTINNTKAVMQNKRCSSCGDFMILKKGKYGLFYGCHSYPRCKNTEEC